MPSYFILKPAIYSKTKTVNQLLDKLRKYPEQKCNTPKALHGLVTEFVLAQEWPSGPVGSLPEYVATTNCKQFDIKIQNTIVTVKFDSTTEKFIATKVEEKHAV